MGFFDEGYFGVFGKFGRQEDEVETGEKEVERVFWKNEGTVKSWFFRAVVLVYRGLKIKYNYVKK